MRTCISTLCLTVILSTPAVGAFENGTPPLRFGREAAPGFKRTPWEIH